MFAKPSSAVTLSVFILYCLYWHFKLLYDNMKLC